MLPSNQQIGFPRFGPGNFRNAQRQMSRKIWECESRQFSLLTFAHSPKGTFLTGRLPAEERMVAGQALHASRYQPFGFAVYI